MRLLFSIVAFCIAMCGSLFAQQRVSSGKLVEFKNFNSKYVKPRDVNVWVPSDYSSDKKYSVLYMHDGQMLFDAATTWNKQEWKVDEEMGKLLSDRKLSNCIVVAISNVEKDRYYDYFPQKSLNYLPADSLAKLDVSRFSADNYLHFIVDELKPYVDKNFSTYTDPSHTYVMGSSMGGLISLYALCEYPNVFGGAACLSIHTPMVLDGSASKANVWAKAFRDYLAASLPEANSRLIYIDRGDHTLDASYTVFHQQLDSVLTSKGWQFPQKMSKIYPGAAHTETDWSKRLRSPLLFLLANKDTEQVERIDPPFWWCGMNDSELQLMVYGTNIGTYTPEIAYSGVQIKRVERVESPDYLFIYLDVKNALPGKFPIEFTKGKQKISYKYELKGRQARASEKEGFNSSDVIYLMMPDRFANGDMGNDKVEMKYPYTVDRSNVSARHGGDLAGVKRHIDYLTELGVTALWMTPVLENDMGEGSYHGYAATDYYKIDPRFGTNEEYVDLVKSLHDKGIKVIMDMVFNHCGSRHPWMNDQPTADWFNNPDSYVQTNHNKTVFFDPYASDIDRKEMTDGWFVPTMPDLNQRNPHLAKYLIQNSIWWVEYADLNGIRQDTYPYPDSDMMKRWCNALYAEYPDINIVGEAMITNPFGAAFWQKNSRLNFNGNTDLKSVMDFHLSSVASKAFHEETYWAGGLQTIFEHFVCDFAYPDIKNVMRLLDNHDMDRFLVEEPKDLNAFKQATTLLLTVPGIPQLYYGHELAFYGSSKVDYGYVRPDMPGGWMGDSLNVFEEQGRTAIQREAFKFTKNLLNWRKGNKVISEGTMKHFVPRNGVYVYARSYEGKTVVVVMNGMKSEVELPLAPYAEVLGKAEKAYDVLTGRHIALQNKLMLAPKAVLLLEL